MTVIPQSVLVLWLIGFVVAPVAAQMEDASARVSWPGASLADLRCAEPADWRLGRDGQQVVLELLRPPTYSPPQRSPRGIALLPYSVTGDFRLELEARQTGREYAHRDLCVFFDVRSERHFGYAHLSTLADENAHHVQRVDAADRSPVTTRRTGGVDWGRGAWKRVVLERRGSKVTVWFDGALEPVLEGDCGEAAEGWVGVGSFDDTGSFRNLSLEAGSGRIRAAVPPCFRALPRATAPAAPRDVIHGAVRRLDADGGWCWFEGPRVAFSAGHLVVGSVASGWLDAARSGNIELLVHAPQTRGTRRIVLARGFQRDDHDQPGLLALPGERLLAVFSKHGNDNLSLVSRCHPGDPGRWEPVRRVTLGARSRITYSNLVRLEQEGGRLYNFFRGLDGSWKPSFLTSEDEGAHWKRGGIVIDVPGEVKHRPYVVYADDGQRTIHFLYTEGHPRNYDNSVWHAFYREGTLHGSAGRAIAPLSEGLRAPSQGTRVFQGGPEKVAWVCDMVLDARGRPRALFTVQRDSQGKPPRQGGEDHRVHYAAFDGTRWNEEEIGHAGQRLYAGEDDYTGLAVLDPVDPSIVYLSTDADPKTGSPLLDPAGKERVHELFVGRRDENGWTFTPLTERSSVDNLRPLAVADPDGRTTWIVWLRGRYFSYTKYQQEVLAMPFRR